MENLCSHPSSWQEALYICFGDQGILCGLKKTLLSKNFFDFKISHNFGAIFLFSSEQACLSDKITDQELVTLLNKEHLLAFY